MKNILDIKYSKLNHMEKLLRDFDFYKKYKIGACVKYGYVGDITLGKNYKEGSKYKISSLDLLPCRITNDRSEVFGRYNDGCGRHHSEKYCVLTENKDTYTMSVNIEYISGPYVEGHEHYEYGDGNVPMSEFAYGVIGGRYKIFEISKNLTDDEVRDELSKVLKGNSYYFDPVYTEERKLLRLKKKKMEEMAILEKEISKLDKSREEKNKKYLKLKEELGI